MKKNIRRVFFIFVAMFLVIILYLVNFILIESKEIINSTINPRVRMPFENIKRGSILDSNLNVIAESVFIDGEYLRVYNYNESFSHVVGFIGPSYSGIEERYNFFMQNLSFEVFQRSRNIFTNTSLYGDNLVLTIDRDLQNFVFNTLGTNRGSIVVMEPSTGKILAMASYPNFNPNNIEANWDSLRADNENSPLLNRATQGLYPPGSTFKLITAVLGMEHIENFENYTYECVGHITLEGETIRCYNSTAHGNVNVTEAMRVSCNTFFVHIANIIGSEHMIYKAESLYFNKEYPFSLARNTSQFSLDPYSLPDLMQTSIGQGRTLVTPLHMAMITSAIANGGMMMEPYVVDHVLTPNGVQRNKRMPRRLTQAFTLEESIFLTDMMVGVVDSGTGRNASVSGIQIAGKTGTAQNETDYDHGWFVAFAPAYNPEIAIAIVLEGSQGTRRVLPMARDIIAFALD